MNQPPESVDESKRRILEHHRAQRKKRLEKLKADLEEWMKQGRNLIYRVQAEIEGDETTVRLPRLPR